MKRISIARVILWLFFAALIAVPVILTRKSSGRNDTGAQLNAQSALSRYGFYFTEDSARAGVHFMHQAPVLDPKLAAIMPSLS